MVAKKMDESPYELGILRVLRHRESQRYFKDGGWTRDARQANHFADVVQAAEICVRYDLNDVELALRYGTANSDLFCTLIR